MFTGELKVTVSDVGGPSSVAPSGSEVDTTWGALEEASTLRFST
jgi:hypothetical protein